MHRDAPISSALAALVDGCGLTADPLQAAAARELDRLTADLARAPGLFRKPKPVVGVYLVGAVGRGKTMLMDLFFSAVPEPRKRRVHFDEFMDEVHTGIAEARRTGAGDPVAAVTKPLAQAIRLLCLDEFQVTDITNAMLLGRLFEQLFAAGVTLVATSNTRPADLYAHGLNRQLFVPFIGLLEQHVAVVTLDGPTDYRRLKFAGETVYQFGTGPAVDAAMDRLWLKFTGGHPGAPETLRSLGRDIAVPLAAMGAARFDFAALCEAPLGARDYLRLAHAYGAVLIDGVPQFGATNPSAAKRFVLLIDTLYDRGMRLGASFAIPLTELAKGTVIAGEFQRTLSRLEEMQSAAYLAAGPKRS